MKKKYIINFEANLRASFSLRHVYKCVQEEKFATDSIPIRSGCDYLHHHHFCETDEVSE